MSTLTNYHLPLYITGEIQRLLFLMYTPWILPPFPIGRLTDVDGIQIITKILRTTYLRGETWPKH